jgi:hypothetical protein
LQSTVSRGSRRTIYVSQGIAASLPWHHGAGPPAATILLIAVVVFVPVAAAVLIVGLAGWSRAMLRRRRARLGALRAANDLEARARALMSELCPHGWRAQITLFGSEEERPQDAPDGDRGRVALDWAEFDDELGHVAVIRRVWAPTIAEALDAMVTDRRMDETLEQIERSASVWPDN